eukprot:Hpha_TRINITY_DN16507_c0_g1::TRINITY_DN16507_c0_g1_i1::g.136170::m.136170
MAELRQRKPEAKADTDLSEVKVSELEAHSSSEDPWLEIGGRVYAVKDYLAEHPGGEEVMLEHAGKDATVDFRNVGHGEGARKTMKKYLVGKLEGKRLLTDEELASSGGGSGGLILVFVLLAVIAAYVFYTQKQAQAA